MFPKSASRKWDEWSKHAPKSNPHPNVHLFANPRQRTVGRARPDTSPRDLPSQITLGGTWWHSFDAGAHTLSFSFHKSQIN